jgi:hypothetical protein
VNNAIRHPVILSPRHPVTSLDLEDRELFPGFFTNSAEN